MVFSKLLTTIFRKRLEDTIGSDKELSQLIKEGDLILIGMKKEVLEALVDGRNVPSWAMRNINLNDLSNDEKRYLKIKILESILNNRCPDSKLVDLVGIDNEHPIWEKYTVLKAASSSQEKKNEQKIKRAKAYESKVKNEEVKKIIEKYGQANYEKAKAGELFEDMEEALLLISQGDPDKKEANLIKGKKSSVWYYGKHVTRLNTEAFNLMIRLVEGRVKGWKYLK